MVPRGHTGTRWPIGRPCTVEAPCHEVKRGGANNGGDNRACTKSFQSVELIECLH